MNIELAAAPVKAKARRSLLRCTPTITCRQQSRPPIFMTKSTTPPKRESHTIIRNRTKRNQNQRLQKHSNGECVQCKTRRARLAPKRSHNTLILVVRGRRRSLLSSSANEQPRQTAPALLSRSFQTRRDPIRAQHAAFTRQLFECDGGE